MPARKQSTADRFRTAARRRGPRFTGTIERGQHTTAPGERVAEAAVEKIRSRKKARGA